MFGGLEVKGNKDGSDDQKMSSSAAAPAPASNGSSAFGFLNPAAPSTPESEATGPASSFSFLNSSSAAAAAAQQETGPPAPAATSGFSFMTQETNGSSANKTTIEETSKEHAKTPSSGFDFLIPSPTSDGNEEADALPSNHSPDEPTQVPEITSGFSFLSSPATEANTPDRPIPVEIPVIVSRNMSTSSANSSVVTAPSPTPPNVLEITAAPSNTMPTCAGITFGTSTKRNVVKKKKTRAARIGTGVGGTPPVPPSSAAVPAPSTTTAENNVGSKSARDEAIEAARRAEEFMQSKSMEEVKSEASVSPPRPATTLTKEKLGSSGGASLDIKPTASTDEVLAAAQAAAEEAKILQQKQKGGGFMGTFFKGFRASPNTTGIGGATNSSIHTEGSGGGIERFAKEQQEMKRAMAERQIQLQEQQYSTSTTTQVDNVPEDGEDSEVVATTITSKYKAEAATLTTTSASTFTPVTLPPATSVNNSFGNKVSSAFAASKPALTTFNVPEVKMPSSLPTPKKSKTSTQIFEEYQELFAQSVHRAMVQVQNVRNQEKMLSEERFVSLAKDRLATQQIKQTEEQLQAAVEEEDYELADQLGHVVEGHKREKHEVGLMLENITKALAQLDSQKELVVKSVATCFDNLSVRLEELKEKEAATERKDDEETLKQFASISKQLSAEQERLQQDLKHLERDEHLVAEERKELEDAIKEQTGEIEKQKDAVSSKLDGVQKEIDELRKLLETKQKEAADLRTEMFGFEDSISKVRVKFSRQLNRVDKKERALKESRSEWGLEDSTHKKQKEAHELQVQSHSEALLAHDALMKTLESELKLSKEFCKMIPSQLGFTDEENIQGEGKSEGGDEGDLAQLQADVVKCEAAVSEAKILLKAASSVVANLEAEHDRLVASIPELEAQKREAASKRDFKAASKASKEIKDASARIKECEEELKGEAANKKKAAEDELNRLDAELVRTRDLAYVKEKLSGQGKMAQLAKKIAQLLEKKNELCGECSSEENSVKGVGALVLEGQIKALKTEGQDLGSKYGGWQELMKEHNIEESEPTISGESPDLNTNIEGAEESSARTTGHEESLPEPDDGLSIEERVLKVKGLVAKMKEVEQALENAATDEDFEKAAELQEQIESLAADIASIDLPEEMLELAVSGEDDNNEVSSSQPEVIDETTTGAKEEEEVDSADEETTEQANDNLDEKSANDTEYDKDDDVETIEDDINEEPIKEKETPEANDDDDTEEVKVRTTRSSSESVDAVSIEGLDDNVVNGSDAHSLESNPDIVAIESASTDGDAL